MASRNYGTLTADTVATETVTGSHESVLVTCVGTGPIYATVDGTAPTVQGDDTYVVPTGTSRVIEAPRGSSVTVKLISAGTPDYGVEAYDP